MLETKAPNGTTITATTLPAEIKPKKWYNDLQDEKGVYTEISKHDLTVDPSYQRPPKQALIRRIARNFSWKSFETLTAFQRTPEPPYFLVDGQQRQNAALLREDVDLLPCMLYPSKGAAEEALKFREINKNRVQLNAYDNYKAALEQGVLVHKKVQKLLDFYDYKMTGHRAPAT